MKKIMLIGLVSLLAACQAPYNRNVYQATGPRVCTEHRDAFVCSAPQKVWNETVYPKNDAQIEMGWSPNVYIPYQGQSLSQTVYGTTY